MSSPLALITLGASAGGLSALERFVRRVPEDSGWAIVVVQHLSPDFKSLMEDLLSRHTTIPVRRVTDGMALEANAIYLIPPRVDMSVESERLHLHERPAAHPAQARELPINLFFRSAAQSWGKRAVAVVLSGTGSDGAQGARMVAAAGGLVLAQDPEDAEFPGMPESVLGTGLVNAVGRAEDLPEAIGRLLGNPQGNQTRAKPRLDDQGDGTPLTRLLAHLSQVAGIDFRQYKPTTIQRRVERRMGIRQVDSIEDYYSAMIGDDEERAALLHDLLIGVTCFFRDGAPFWELRDRLLPELLSRKPAQQEFRAWVAGCATGEEAYSLAMIVHDVAQRVGYRGSIRIFASDVHRPALRLAAAGQYPTTDCEAIPEEYRKRFLVPLSDRTLRVTQVIRDSVVFTPHNLLSDPPFTRLDLVTCRNMLIYLQSQAQEMVLQTLRFSLVREGMLFLGASEGLGRLEGDFLELNGPYRLYSKVRDGLPPPVHPWRAHASELLAPRPRQQLLSPSSSELRLLQDYEQVLAYCDLAALLIDERRQLLHTFGEASRLLLSKSGRFDGDVLSRLPEPLVIAVGSLIQRAELTKQVTRCEDIRLETSEQGGNTVNVMVTPLADRVQDSCHFLVTFSFRPWQGDEDVTVVTAENRLSLEQTYRQRLRDLEQELSSTKQNLQATIEELQTTNEELQSTNEELQSANEELQSANEELHSVNEELYTVNAEYEQNNRRLAELAQDHESLLDATDMAIIFIDAQGRVRRFNRIALQYFRLLPQDIGRSLVDIVSDLPLDTFEETVRKVARSGQREEQRLELVGDRTLLARYLPYADEQGRPVGVLLTLTDFSQIERMQRQMEHGLRLESVGRLAGGIAHDFNNILGGILGFGDMLYQSQGLDSRQRQWTERILLAGRHAAELVGGLLHFARRGRDEATTCSLRDVLNDALVLCESSLGEQVRVNLDIPNEGVFAINGNAIQLQSAVVNLLINARDAMPQGGNIDVSLRQWEYDPELVSGFRPAVPAGHYFSVRIADQGQGIDPAVLPHLFEPFATSKPQGTGLGLAVVYGTLVDHGGSIRVQSAATGTCVEMILPSLPQDPAAPSQGTISERLRRDGVGKPKPQPLVNEAQPRASTGALTEPDQGEACCILVVDDEPLMRELLTDVLRDAGYTVCVTDSGQKALKLLSGKKPKLLISDVRMPGMDGPTLLRQVRSQGITIPFIFLSGYPGEAAELTPELAISARALLPKPLNIQSLLSEVAGALAAT